MASLPKPPANYDRLYIAVLTPMNEDESIDELGFRQFIEYFMSYHATNSDIGLIINPEAGEVFCLSPEEQLRLINIANEVVKGRAPIFSGFMGYSTAVSIELAKAAKKAGVDGLFLMPPIGSMDITIAWDAVQYPEVWIDVIARLTKAIPDLPMLVHPTAAPSAKYGVGLPLEPTMKMLQKFPQIVGWKMVYNYEGHRKVSRAIRSMDRHVALLGATAVNFHEMFAAGNFDGTVTGSFNYALEPMLDHINAWRAKDYAKAQVIWDGGLSELHEYVYETMGRLHIRYKAATWLRGLIKSPMMRSPMPKPRKEEVQTLYQLLSRLKVSIIAQNEVDKVLATL